MEHIKTPFKGILNDVRGRAACYKQDWVAGILSGFGYLLMTQLEYNISILSLEYYLNFLSNFSDSILAPTTYIFFASALPVIAFGEQLRRDTGCYFLSSSCSPNHASLEKYNPAKGGYSHL
jgi:hypothetical protein